MPTRIIRILDEMDEYGYGGNEDAFGRKMGRI
jgi:hypothetical protein